MPIMGFVFSSSKKKWECHVRIWTSDVVRTELLEIAPRSGVEHRLPQLIAWSLPGKGQSTSQQQLLGTCMHDRTYVIVSLGAVC